MSYQTLSVAFDDGVCRVRFDRPEAGNAIDARMVEELGRVLALCDDGAEPPVTVLVLEGSADAFCVGGDFAATAAGETLDAAALYDLWRRLATGPYVSIALVHGRANAGGVGFVAASDLVLAGPGASFGLSELLFGLFPACVLPFLIRRVGRQKAHAMTLLTRPVGAAEALACGLADAVEDDPEALLGRHLSRLRLLGKPALGRYKSYLAEISDELERCRPAALAANRALFADPSVQRNIRRYVTELKLPWED